MSKIKFIISGLRKGTIILRKGADNLKLGDIGQYHQALSVLRKRFKLKKQGVHVLGDATYRSCGSKYTHEGEAYTCILVSIFFKRTSLLK